MPTTAQKVKYKHDVIGVNSRLDTIQAAILIVKLKSWMNIFHQGRLAAKFYCEALAGINEIILPHIETYTTHVFHQFTIRVNDGRRDELKEYLENEGVPSMIYYPYPLHFQEAFIGISKKGGSLDVSESLCKEVLSLPMHTELSVEQLEFITAKIKKFYE